MIVSTLANVLLLLIIIYQARLIDRLRKDCFGYREEIEGLNEIMLANADNILNAKADTPEQLKADRERIDAVFAKRKGDLLFTADNDVYQNERLDMEKERDKSGPL